MTPKLVVTGILAGVLVFFWSFFAHSVLGISESAMKTIPNEPAVIGAISTSISESGFYFFPGSSMEAQKAPKDQQAAAVQKADNEYKTLPHGILIVRQPDGSALPFARLLISELITDIICGLLVAVLLSMAATSLSSTASKVLFTAVIGLFASISIDASYWIWYDFPGRYLVGSIVESTIGWALAGFLIALLTRRRG
jgi:hypothetical protein